MDKIILEGLEFYAYHGFYPEEQKIGGMYHVDLEIETDLSKAAETDHLSSTLDYGSIYACVKAEMNENSKLIEHVAGRISNSLFRAFLEISKLKVKVSKINPPLAGKAALAAVVIEKERN